MTVMPSNLGTTPETLRRWVRRVEIDGGVRTGLSTDEHTRLRELEREVRELRRANQILQDASIFFATALDGRTKRECVTSSAGKYRLAAHRPRRIIQRPLQDRTDPPTRTLEERRLSRIGHTHLHRLVQQPSPSRRNQHALTSRIRNHPLSSHHPKHHDRYPHNQVSMKPGGVQSSRSRRSLKKP